MQSCTTLRTGLRNSSIGVPMVTMTGAFADISAGAEVKTQPVLLERLRQQLLAAELDERQAAGAEALEHGAIGVVHVDAITGLGEGQDQRDADVAAATDHGQVDRIDLRGQRPCRLGTGKIHAISPKFTAARTPAE